MSGLGNHLPPDQPPEGGRGASIPEWHEAALREAVLGLDASTLEERTEALERLGSVIIKAWQKGGADPAFWEKGPPTTARSDVNRLVAFAFEVAKQMTTMTLRVAAAMVSLPHMPIRMDLVEESPDLYHQGHRGQPIDPPKGSS